jgi:hypothetical protein
MRGHSHWRPATNHRGLAELNNEQSAKVPGNIQARRNLGEAIFVPVELPKENINETNIA